VSKPSPSEMHLLNGVIQPPIFCLCCPKCLHIWAVFWL